LDGRSGEVEPRPLLVGAEWFPDTPGGLNRTFRGLFLGLAEAGLESAAVVIGPAREPAPGLTVIPPGPLPLRLVRVGAALARLRSQTNLVNAHFALYGTAAALAARLARRPLVVHFHGPWADESAVQGGQHAWRLGAKRRVERAVYRSAAVHVVHTEAFKRLLVERYGVSPATVEIVPPPVDLDHFTPGDRAAARERLGIAPDGLVGVSVRRLTPRMGLDDLLRAWWALGRDDADVYLAGTGPDRERLEGIARELGLAARVHFLGNVADELLPDVYRAADVCVAPSRQLEGFGLVALEALACGTPVIVSDSGGLPEAVGGLAADLVFPAGDHAALARRLAAALDGSRPLPAPEECRSYAELFSPERFIAAHADLYARALRA
jgi:glycosyltransferase involved in cell wall biosynthesis